MSCSVKTPTAPNLARINHRPLIVADFRDIPAGTRLTMYYKRFNEGKLIWEHISTEGDRLVGRFYLKPHGWSCVGSFVYQHENVLCCGSGREPLWACPPERWGAGAWSQEDTSSDEEE
jgi:hypothetical protein